MARPAIRTFLFSDIRDYTYFVETQGDAAATKMIRSSRRIVRAEVARHRGAEIKTEGDSFYVVFRSPSAAVRCAVAIVRRAAGHNRREPQVPVLLGIGINTGEAIPHDDGYVGAAVILAQRLTANARAGQILVTDTVRALVRTGAHAPMRDVGTWTFKGISQAVRVYEVDPFPGAAIQALGPVLPIPAMLLPPPTAATLVVCPELIQREGAISTLAQQLEAAAKGASRLVAISGEAGVGKSRLCREIAEIASRSGFYALGGRAHRSGGTYEAVVAAFRPYARARGTEILRRLLGTLIVELRRILPEIDVAAPEQSASIPDDERRERFFRTAQLLLEDAASLRPVLLVLEDLHDADAATFELLRHIAVSLHAGICIVMTYREEELSRARGLGMLMNDLDRDRRLVRLRVRPLDSEGVARMTAALVPGRRAPELAQAVFERTQGNPYYIEELLKTALDDPSATLDRLALPATIRDSVRLRLDRLEEKRGPGATDLLEAAAIAEVPLGYDVILGLSTRRDETEAVADLDALVEAQLLERPPTRADIYQFRHALTREAITSALPQARARELHRRVAEALEQLELPGSRAALLAGHFARAGDRSRALRYGREGAAEAIRLGAYATAIELLHAAAEQARSTPTEAAVLEELGSALQAAGRASDAEAALLRARELSAADPIAVARLDDRVAAVLRMQGRRTEAKATASRAIAALEAGPGNGLAEALVTLSSLHWAENEAERAVSTSERALTIARESGSTRTVVSALTINGAARARLGLSAGIDVLEEAIRIGTAAQLGSETIEAYYQLSRAQLLLGLGEEARRSAERGLALARERGLEFDQARLLSLLVRLVVNEGRYREAQALAEQAVALATPGTVAATGAKVALASVMTSTGQSAEGLAILDQVESQVERNEPDRRLVFFAYRAEALLGLGRLDEAKAVAARAVELTLSRPGLGMSGFLQATDVAEALADASWIEELSQSFERYFAGRDTGGIRAVRAEMRAVVAICTGGDPSPHFERAAAEYEALGARHRAMFRRASSLLAQLRKASATTARQLRREILSVRSYLEEWGAMRYVYVIDRAMARAPRPRAPKRDVLGQTELRTAMLLSRGLTDAAIARELKISIPRATGSVRRVLDKLGVRTRSQVASWAVDRGVLEKVGR